MKTIRRIAIACCIVLWAACCFVSAEEGPSLSWNVEYTSTNECSVSLQLEQAEGIAMYQFTLIYDEEVMEVLSVKKGELLEGNFAPTINAGISGKVIAVWDTLYPLKKDGEILKLQIRLKKENAELSFDLEEELIFADDQYQLYDVQTESCKLERQTVSSESSKEVSTEQSMEVSTESSTESSMISKDEESSHSTSENSSVSDSNDDSEKDVSESESYPENSVNESEESSRIETADEESNSKENSGEETSEDGSKSEDSGSDEASSEPTSEEMSNQESISKSDSKSEKNENTAPIVIGIVALLIVSCVIFLIVRKRNK